MNTDAVLNDLRTRLEAGYPLLFLQTWEEQRWEQMLAELARETDRQLLTWTLTAGLQPAPDSEDVHDISPTTLLNQLLSVESGRLILIKDFVTWIDDPVILRGIRDRIDFLTANDCTLVFLGTQARIPADLTKDAVRLELPLPDYEDLQPEFARLLEVRRAAGEPELNLEENETDKLIKAVMGLTSQEARKAWRRALRGCSALSDDVFTTLIAEKRTLASGSELLEFYDLQEGVGDIGGLDSLKEWMRRRAEAYSPRAREQGLPLPKGVLLLGVQGCGKSLTARAAARLLAFPLIRLDIANLLDSARGESEKNMRNALSLVASIAPAVLWLDEIEKGFAGVETDGGSAGGDATMTRLVGSFLTWMSEIQKPIFVIATANSVQNLPPEMLRRGRFDELFFVDLPNFDERKTILGIHLKKRGWKPEQFNLDDLASRSEGFSGAELEQIVITALLDAFGQGHLLNQDDLERAWRSTVPLSVTMEDKIFALRNWAQDRCRRATSDSRVTSMLETEAREESLRLPEPDDDDALPAWAQLAHSGQHKAALVEYVRATGDVLFPELSEALGKFMDVAGDQGLAARANPNTVLWAGMSQSLCELICELVAARRIYIHPTDVERYKAQQQLLRLPVLKEPTDTKLPRPAWLPSSLRCAPHPVHAARLARIGRMRLGRA